MIIELILDFTILDFQVYISIPFVPGFDVHIIYRILEEINRLSITVYYHFIIQRKLLNLVLGQNVKGKMSRTKCQGFLMKKYNNIC